jgi:hypothetical protein
MDNSEDRSFPADGFEVEVSRVGADDALPVESSPEHVLFRTSLARRLAVALGVLLMIALIVVSVPSLPGQVLGLFAAPAPPTSEGSSSVSINLQLTSGTGWVTNNPTIGPGWTQAGPLYASGIAIAPSAPAAIYTCGQQSPSNGSLVPLILGTSKDGARTWQAFSTPAVGLFCDLTVNPMNPLDVLLIASPDNTCSAPSSLYRTFDGGAHWSHWSLPQAALSLCYQWAWAGSTLYLAPFLSNASTYQSLAVSVAGQPFVWANLQSLFANIPSAPTISELLGTTATLYALVGSQTDATACCWFMQSRDGGMSWERFAPTRQEQAVYLMRASLDGRTLLGQVVTSGKRAYARSTDGGATWSNLPPLPTALIAGTMQVTPDGTVYADFDQNLSQAPDAAQLGIYAAAPGVSSWAYITTAPPDGVFVVSCDATGHPAALWGRVDWQQPTAGLEYYPL